jgi:hypothetical protein
MNCRGCKRTDAFHVSTRFDAKTGEANDVCNWCGGSSRGEVPYAPDVWWPGHAYTSENITDKMGKPILMESRQHKVRVMREQGIREAGDTFRGVRSGI